MTAAPLHRNRDFLLLQFGQLLSTTGSQAASVAYPLLVLALTGSPAKAGVVGFARILPGLLFSLLGGVAADRYNRKVLMIMSDTLRAAAVGSLAFALLTGRLTFWHILIVAFIEGSLAVFFRPASSAALRSVVPADLLPSAVAAQQARVSTASLAGPPLGGAMFAVSRALPFIADALSYTFSVISILLIRKPFQEQRAAKRAPIRTQLAEGWQFLWRQPFLRTTTFLYGLTNFIGPGLTLAIVVIGKDQGLPTAMIGTLLAVFSGCTLLGSSISGFARRRLSPHAVLLLELWAWTFVGVFLIWPNAYVLALSMLPAALAIPITNSLVVGYRLQITPDSMVGRVESVRSNIALALAPFGSLVAGLLLEAVSPRLAMVAFVAVALLLAAWGTVSPVLKDTQASMRTNLPGAEGGASASPDTQSSGSTGDRHR